LKIFDGDILFRFGSAISVNINIVYIRVICDTVA